MHSLVGCVVLELHLLFELGSSISYSLKPAGKAPCRSLRELEKEIGRDLDSQLDPMGKNMTVYELVERYLKTRTGVKPNTLMNYGFVKNILLKEEFGSSTIKTVRGVLRPAFQMAVDDDMLVKNPPRSRCILFHTGMRISEFCGLTFKDVDMENRLIDINHQLQRTSWGEYVIEATKTNARTRKLPMIDDVY